MNSKILIILGMTIRATIEKAGALTAPAFPDNRHPYPLICRLESSRAIVSNTSISSDCVGAS